jgi:hypothetical protein
LRSAEIAPKIAAALNDEKVVVRFTAAACVAHLSEPPEERHREVREAVALSAMPPKDFS